MGEFSDLLVPEPVEVQPLRTPNAIVESSNRLAVDLWRRIHRQSGNLALSPVSISLALAMTWAGARGETAAQLARVLHIEGREAIHEAAATILRNWADPRRTSYEMRAANRLFCEQIYPLEDSYVQLLRQRYGAPIERVDFLNSPEPSRTQINDWVRAQTDDRIRLLLAHGTIHSGTRLALVNAVYFRGEWQHRFHERGTHDVAFRTPSGEVRVPMMHRTIPAAYGRTGVVETLELQYSGGEVGMTVVLPRKRNGLEELEANLTGKQITRWLEKLFPVEVEVLLPSFVIDPPNALDLKPLLAAMGAPLPFDPAEADFTGIANPPNPEDRLFLDAILHKPFVEVNEEGTEAAAASAATFTIKGLPPVFRADRPFLFLIRDLRTGMILFLGRVVDPRG